jgi:hypothetical protein
MNHHPITKIKEHFPELPLVPMQTTALSLHLTTWGCTMVRFQCESCGRMKGDGETWILGFAAENIGVTSARREISIASSWDRPRAVEALAVHFCSDECRATYMTALFGNSPNTLAGASTSTKRRIKRVLPGAVVDTAISEKSRPKAKRRTVVRRKIA